MKDPKILTPKHPGASYLIPTYNITNEGIEDGIEMYIQFCKGNKSDESGFRQSGVFTESLIQLAKEYLETVNVGPLASRETSMAITKLDEALMWIDKRTADRKRREVQATYKP